MSFGESRANAARVFAHEKGPRWTVVKGANRSSSRGGTPLHFFPARSLYTASTNMSVVQLPLVAPYRPS